MVAGQNDDAGPDTRTKGRFQNCDKGSSERRICPRNLKEVQIESKSAKSVLYGGNVRATEVKKPTLDEVAKELASHTATMSSASISKSSARRHKPVPAITRLRMARSKKGVKFSDEHKRNLAKRWTPAYRKLNGAKVRAANDNPDSKARKSASISRAVRGTNNLSSDQKVSYLNGLQQVKAGVSGAKVAVALGLNYNYLMKFKRGKHLEDLEK